jgi:DNA-binding NarL/FixJ family response regulator
LIPIRPKFKNSRIDFRLALMLNTLIVEDNAAHRQSLHDLLVRQFPSMRIFEAADGEQAIGEALARHFDLIFMDIRLPRGNGLNLTRTIKTVWADTMICVLTSYDIDEYRQAAFQNGADHFMVKGDSTEAEIVGMVESMLHMHFVSLIIDSDPASREQLNTLLAIHWPDMIVGEADNASEGLVHVMSLKPDLVLLELRLPGVDVMELAQLMRTISKRSVLIGMTADEQVCSSKPVTHSSLDYCVSLAPSAHAGLVDLVNALQSGWMCH